MSTSTGRPLIRQKWCPSCSFAVLRAFASVCGTPIAVPTRRINRIGYRGLRANLRLARGLNGVSGKYATSSNHIKGHRSYSTKEDTEVDQQENSITESNNGILLETDKSPEDPPNGVNLTTRLDQPIGRLSLVGDNLQSIEDSIAEELDLLELDSLESELNEPVLGNDGESQMEEVYEEDIEYKATESSFPQGETEGTPWYLKAPPPPSPIRYVSPLIETTPPLPPDPPKNLEALLDYLLKDLSLSKLKILDLRGLDPPPALGANVIMILATARSERHMTIAGDKCSRHLRSILHGSPIYADGLMGRGEIKLREKRDRRKGKIRTAEDIEAMKLGWICVNSNSGIVVQIMTSWKRTELNLENLWGRKIHTSQKRKLKEQLAAQGLSEEEIKEKVDAEIPKFTEFKEESWPEGQTADTAVLRPSQVLPPTAGQVELDEYQEVLQAVEIRSKSTKRHEGRRYVDVPVRSKNRAWRDRLVKDRVKRKALKDPVIFSTKRDYSTNSRGYTTAAEIHSNKDIAFLGGLGTESLETGVEDLVRMGNYKKLLKAFPRPRTNAQNTLVLLAHLNHLVLTPPEIARSLLLSSTVASPNGPEFLHSFELSLPRLPSTTHNHITALMRITAHNLSPLEHPLKKFVNLPSEILRSGQQVPLVTYHAILRAVATSIVLRGDSSRSMRFWTNRTTDTLSIMMLYLIQKMDVVGIDVANDPEVFESIWLALSPTDTAEYIATLGNPGLRSQRRDPKKPFSRAIDHRSSLFLKFHEMWYDPTKFIPKDCSYLRDQVETEVLNKLMHPSLVYPPMRPNNIYSRLPSYLVTMFVTYARGKGLGKVRHLFRWLSSRRVRRPKALYALYFELLSREGLPDEIIEALRIALTDYEREFVGRNDGVEDGVAESLLACIDYIDSEVPGTGLEFSRWRRRCRMYIAKKEGKTLESSNEDADAYIV